MQNPPEEVDLHRFQSISIVINGVEVCNDSLVLRHGEKIDGRLVMHGRTDAEDWQSLQKTIQIRLFPEGSGSSEWKNFDYAPGRLIHGAIQDSGEGKIGGTVKTVPGIYDVRCYAVLVSPIRETPEFYLLRTGKLEVTE
ncbi:MAG: hypothetical protein KDA96_25245 [Planctomycetaceae bacterium]|nr:hypothetical protein [Planctomycetaceae bacterium]